MKESLSAGEFMTFTNFHSSPEPQNTRLLSPIITRIPTINISYSIGKFMGACTSKNKSNKSDQRKNVWSLAEKMRLLQQEINEMMHLREKEAQAYDGQMMVFAFKEAEWKTERKMLKEEVKRLKKTVEEKEERIRGMEDCGVAVGEKCLCDKGWPLLGTSYLVEQMREERARRDEAVEKWKQLYLAIKTELDDLIQRTNGEALGWRDEEEEEMVEELKMEVKRKEETIETLTGRLASMEREVYESKLEIDILRQSLRIMSSKKKESYVSKPLSQYLWNN